MKTQIYEGQRVSVSDSDSKIVSFTEKHETIPIVTLMLEQGEDSETGLDQADLVVVITNVNQTDVAVNFSSNFTGYLHIHAFFKIGGFK